MAGTKNLFIIGAEVGIEMEMPRSATFLQVKQKIKEITKVEVDRQTLFYNDVRLEDDSLIRSIVYGEYEVLHLTVAPLPENPRFVILAKSSNREDDPVTVKETQSVDHLRNKISTRWGISPPTKIVLLHLNHVMEDGHRLCDYFVGEGSEVRVMIEPH